MKEGRPNLLGEPILQNGWIIWSPLLYLNFKNLRDPNSSSSSSFQCILHDSAVVFSFFSYFLKLKRGYLISWGEPILQNCWIIWSPLLYLNFKNLRDPNSLSSSRFQCILHDSAVLFSVFSNFLKLKMGELISWGEPILQSGWIIWCPLLYFHFKSLRDPNSSSSSRFQCILHDSAGLFSVFSNFLKLKMGELISWGEPILQNGWIIWSPLLYFNIQNLSHSNSSSSSRCQCILLDSAVLFSFFANFLKLKRGDLISWGEPILQNGWIIWSPLLYFNFQNLRDPNSSSSGRFQCMLLDSAVLLSVFSNFLKWKRGDLISWGEPILQSGWIIWSPLLYFNFKNLRDPNSSSSSRFQCILHDSAVIFAVFSNFLKLKMAELISWEEPILQNDWIIWSPLVYFNFKSLRDPNSSSSSRFQCILHDSAVLFSVFSNFLKLKRGDLISWGEPILQNGWIIWSPLLYFNFKNLRDPNSSSSSRFQCILHDSAVLFSVFSNFLKLKMAELISWGEPILQNGWIIWSPLLYFNFKNLRDPNSSSSSRFQCILHDSAVLFSVFSNFLKLKRGDLISWGEPILQNGWIIWSPLLYFNFKNLRDPNSSSSGRFRCMLLDSAVLLSVFSNFLKWKRGDLISWGEPILQSG